jgi:imidazole glycerol-phosphate synthase subunit HisH
MSVVIIDYGSGNLHSAAKAFERAAHDSGLSVPVVVTADPDKVRAADRIVLPGVGAFKDCRDGLKAVPGMWDTLEDEVIHRAKPFLGICVGMQLMANEGHEHDITTGFGWIPGAVEPIKPHGPEFKIPHMGWNTLTRLKPHVLLDGLELGPEGLHAYFVHSYHLVPRNRADVIATADHGSTITAMVGRDNMAGTQFHPEKSQALGLTLIANFLRWRP